MSVCSNCIKERFEEAFPFIQSAHRNSRLKFGLPPQPPYEDRGKICKICINQCRIKENSKGYCGSLPLGSLDWYYDSLPTNCVAEKVCDGSRMFGMKNLAVFYRSCSFNCLFCHNWHFKERKSKVVKAEELAELADDKTFCVCYFGGDPTPQISHSIKASRIMAKKGKTICWETNGSMNKNILKAMAELSFTTNGWIKFDIKAWDEKLHYSLCGVSNKWTIDNFSYLFNVMKSMGVNKGIIASTLLIPGYIDENEVYKIASFISSLDKNIPYVLLGFVPHFFFSDLPWSSRSFGVKCFEAALSAGLSSVFLSNIFLMK
ncbi:MAG: radical SAM protein [Candidatus Aminicenantia bacterium]